nr:putative disease resistance protein At3g14460 isoform X2 [Ziziphus jujuba var. spinosa]
MAEKVVDGSVLSASIQVSFLRMASREFVDFVRGNELDKLFDELKKVLVSVSKVMNDAEIKQFGDDRVQRWLDALKDAIYDAEDLVFEIYTEALRCEMKIEEKSATGSSSIFIRVRNCFLSASQEDENSEFCGMIEAKIIELVRFIEERMLETNLSNLIEDAEISTFQRSSETGTLVVEEEFYICGRDADREAIIDLLLSDKDGHKISVIPIVGRVGIGKTALAELVYMDIGNMVNKPFDIKAWITVGHNFDVFTIAGRIFETVANLPNWFDEETSDQLQFKLKESLEGKKFLFVLDNVCYPNREKWYVLKSLFETALHGSKIIVTTRNRLVGELMGNIPHYDVRPLSEENSWRLFSKHVFNNVDPRVSQSLEEIGRQILRKCEGIPLAVKLLAGLLRTELNPMKWKRMLNDQSWAFFALEDRCVAAVISSYFYLPYHLKQCFAYCSIFPYGYRFKKEKLILLWMAQDLLLPRSNKTLEEVGEEYFHDLASRSFFCKSKFGDFTMHDLLYEVAKIISRNLCLCLDVNSLSSCFHLFETRHLSWMENDTLHFVIRNLKCTFRFNLMRTLMRLDGGATMNGKFWMQPMELQNLKRLRVLSLYGVEGIERFLDSIGKLKLLRKLTCLPRHMARLINLHHLDIRATSLREIPPQFTNWRYLEILSDFVVGTSSGSSVKVLGEVQDMHCNLCIRTLEKVVNVDDVSQDDLEDKKCITDIEALGELRDMCDNLSIRSLEKVGNVDDVSQDDLEDEKCITDLSLEWEGDTIDSQKALEVLNRLPILMDLEQLSIINYGGISFSSWVGEHSLSRLVYMWLSKCRNCCNLPPLGQLPSLKSLRIDGFDMMESIGNEFYISGSSTVSKPFKSLEKLSFKFMPRLKEWLCLEGEVFSQLKELHLMDCPSLTLDTACFIDSFPSLKYLCISKCQLQVMASLLSCQLPLLGSLYIGYCPELESFPERRLPTNIHTIEICGCENLKSFLEEGWPRNLKSLSIGSCGKLFAPRMRWNLQTVTSLTSLDFSCIDEVVDSFPEGGQLPTSLTSLTLCRLRNLKSLNGKAFQQLTSLEELSISYCQQLRCMPEECLPATLSSLHLSCLDNLQSLSGMAFGQVAYLEKLSISYCPQLLCIPEEGLPASLSQLTIECCRFLNPRCQRDIGEDWPMIAHIPSIYIIQY